MIFEGKRGTENAKSAIAAEDMHQASSLYRRGRPTQQRIRALESVLRGELAAVSRTALRQDQRCGLSARDRGRHGAAARRGAGHRREYRRTDVREYLRAAGEERAPP